MDAEERIASIREYRNRLWDEIALNVESYSSVDREEFLTYATDLLIEAEEIDDFTYVPYEGLGKRNKRLQIDGYSYSDLDDTLTIFIATPMTYDEGSSLTTTDATRYISMATSFLDNAEYVTDTAEESAPAYGFAWDIFGIYKDVRKYRIFLISDLVKSKNLTQITGIQARGIDVECHIWDISRLYDLSNSRNNREEIEIHLSDFGIKGIPCLPASETADYKAYLCTIPGMVLTALYNRYGGRLLEGNVRSFLQVRGKVNKGIRYTILNEPEMFFAYNNGIAATAFDVKTEEIDGMLYITEITSLQIVNGGQTTASLATALIKDKKDHSEENIQKIYVPMKLSIVQPDKADKLIGNIARYANSQNKVSDADLWSNHPFHIRMEEFSRRIIAPATNGKQYGTYWYYERSNGQYNQETYKSTLAEKKRFEAQHPKSQRITKTEFAKYMHIYQQHPNIAGLGGQKAFVKFSDSVSIAWEKDSASFNEDYFKNAVAVAILFRESDRIVRHLPWYRSYKANIIEYALSKIFYTVETQHQDKAVNLKALWQKQSLSAAWTRQIEDATYCMYQHLIRADRDVENVTEWAKRENCWVQAKSIPYVLLPEFVEELQDKETAKADRKAARKSQKLTDSLTVITDVFQYGTDNWQSLLDWNVSHRLLSPSELHQIELAKRMDGGLLASESKCKKVLAILEKCRTEGYPG